MATCRHAGVPNIRFADLLHGIVQVTMQQLAYGPRDCGDSTLEGTRHLGRVLKQQVVGQEQGSGPGGEAVAEGHSRVQPLAEAYFTQAPIRYSDFLATLAVVPVSSSQRALDGMAVDGDDPEALRTSTVGFPREHDAK